MILAFLVGFVCGFFGSIPIAGPIAVLILERGIKGLRREAFLIAVGATVAETAYALFAFMGMTAALSRFHWLLPASHVLGALILVGLGLVFALSRHSIADAPPPSEERGRGHGKIFLGFLVTAVNPTLLVSWSAVVTVLHATGWLRVEPLDAFPFAIGAGAGILGWFGLWLVLLGRFRSRLRKETLERVVRVMGWLLVVGGVGLLVRQIMRA